MSHPIPAVIQNDFAKLPFHPSVRVSGRTHGVACLPNGEVVVFAQASPAVHFFDGEGHWLRAWGEQFAGAHGLTLVEDQGAPHLWLTDQYTCEVGLYGLDGTCGMRLPMPSHDLYVKGKYVPTWVAVDEKRHGGDGSIWVADGYGSSLVHRFSAEGRHLMTLTGEEGAGRFACPHGIAVDRRRGRHELLIADRGNHRVQVYGMDGNFKRSWGAELLTSPCAFTTWQDVLAIPELQGRVALFDGKDGLLGYLGENPGVGKKEGWPNIPPAPADLYQSPHSAAFGEDGSLYVVEWTVGGRILKATPKGGQWAVNG